MSYGIIEYNEDGNPICEICGFASPKITGHVFWQHGIRARDYKLQFGLDLKKGIISQSLKEKMVQHGYDTYAQHPDQFINGNRFKKGNQGRTKKLMSEQSRIRCAKLAKDLALSGIGNQIKASRYLFGDYKSEKDIWALYNKVDAWSRSTYKEKYDEDIVNQVFCEVGEKGRIDLKKTKMLTWLCACVNNQYLQKFKKQKQRSHVANTYEVHELNNTVQYPTFENKEQLKLIWSCIYSLPMRHQEIIIYKMQGVKNTELEEIYGNTAATIKSLVWLSRNNLKQKLIKVGVL